MSSAEQQAEIKQKRLLLFSTRIRFMPHTQPIRETAIDKILEQNLLLCDTPQLVREIETQCLDLNGCPVLSRADIESSLRRLSGGSVLVEHGHELRYSLSEPRKQDLWAQQSSAEQRYKKIVERLFKGASGGPSRYSSAFLESLSSVFSELGEAYVRHLQGEINPAELMRLANIQRIIEETNHRFGNVDGATLAAALLRFFEEVDPGFADLKWNLAQNYYIAKALGLDPSGKLLTQEIFGDGAFYIDTNVLVHSLDPTGRHHTSFRTLVQSCRQLGIKIHVTQISIDEMRRVAALEKELIAKRVPDKIPAETIAKVRGILLPAYLEQLRTTGSCDLDKLFEKFDRPSESLRSAYAIDVVDDRWFIEAESKAETRQLVEQVRAAYHGPHGRRKGERASLHDALMIRWIAKERATQSPNTWFVTLDTSLPAFRHDCDGQCKPYALTLVGLMQWLSPMVTNENGDGDTTAIFAEALRQQLLPQENFFELRDFLIFSEMELSTHLLPARDVEDCIRAIKIRTPDLNPTNPGDREKLAHEISKFFVDPGRQYKVSLDEQREALSRLAEEFRGHKEDTQTQIDVLRQQVVAKDAAIADLNRCNLRDRLLGEARFRLLLITIGFFLSELVLFYAFNKLGDGSNFFEKLVKALPYGGLLGSLWIVSSWFFLGKYRLNALGWPFTKILRAQVELPESNE